MSPKEMAAMLNNHCNIGVMLIKSQSKIDDWRIKTHAWFYVMEIIMDGFDSMNRARYADEEQYRAFDTALLRAMITGQMLKDLLEDD